MAISMLNDTLYEVVLRGNYNGLQQTNNVFYFRTFLGDAPALALGQPGTIRGLATEFWNNLKTQLRAVTGTIVSYTSVDAYQLDADGAQVTGETYSIPSGERAGTAAGDVLPPTNSWTMQYVRPDTSFKHGSKRFTGVTENMQLNGVIAAGSVATMNALVAVLDNNIIPHDVSYGTNAAGYHAFPVVLQRVINGTNVSPVNWYQPAAIIYTRIGTQNSRKFGHGA